MMNAVLKKELITKQVQRIFKKVVQTQGKIEFLLVFTKNLFKGKFHFISPSIMRCGSKTQILTAQLTMRKQNRHPNHPATKNSSKSHLSSATPDTNTSRITYKPKFIKKNPTIHDELTQHPHPHPRTYQHSTSDLLSPSLTENNTIDIAALTANRQRWRDLYQETKGEMQRRTTKFNKSVQFFCCILDDMRNTVHDENLTNEQKLQATDYRIDSLMEAFSRFRMEDP